MIELNPNDVSKLTIAKNKNVTQVTEQVILLANSLPNEYATQMLQDVIANLEEMKQQLEYSQSHRLNNMDNHIHPGVRKERKGI